MSYRRQGLAVATLLLLATMLSACVMPASTPPLNTPTLIGTGLFVSPFPSVENPMEMIEQFAAGTATAAALSGTPGTPGTPGGTALTPVAGITGSPTSGTPSTPTNSAGVTAVITVATTPVVAITPGGPTPTQAPKPASYTLQQGEFPYCIARRFNVNPEELLSLNGLTDGQVYYPNLTLKIPQTGNPFPADRALRAHPTTYTVASSDETVYGVACRFGNVDPAAIAAANGISVGATLTAGQQLSIP
jgi:LysM repeat protein